ncbi:hypothetical protein [Sphingopyxis sp. L1A2A]|nr:hypothetical protein [Sphingopyxis sp. L1A2A]
MTVKKSVGKTRSVTFGSVTVRAAVPPKAQVAANVALGQSALKRARMKIIKPGVRISPRKDVPLYHVDADKPEEVIRKLDGKVERGHFVNGTFQKL